MEYITFVQTAEQLGITKRQVNALCAAGKIEGAYKSGNRWMIPADAVSRPRKGDAQSRRGINPFPIGISDYKLAVSQYYMLSNDEISNTDAQYFKQVLHKELPDSLWAGTLKRLSNILHNYHKTAPVILIDEYDTPIQQGHMKGYYEKIIGFMRNFLSGGLKDNPCVSRAFMTGILRVAKESIFSGLNNLSVNSVLDKKYSQYFGFTADEVKQLLKDSGKSRKLKEAKEWYNGYLFGGTEIYNPWSILNYADNDFFPQTYWQSTGSNEILGDITESASPEMLEEMRTLLSGQSVSAYIDTSVVYPDVKRNPASVYSFLLMAGYLTV